MAKKKGKSVSFDAMVKFFMQYYNIPTRKDIDKLMAKMDSLEILIKSSAMTGKGSATSGVKATKLQGNHQPLTTRLFFEFPIFNLQSTITKKLYTGRDSGEQFCPFYADDK